MVAFEEYAEELREARIAHIQAELEDANISVDHMQEAYSDAVRTMFAMEDIGWQRLGGPNGEGPGNDLQEAKQLAKKLSDIVVSNPTLKRGNEIRCSYLFSDPYEIGTEDAKGTITPQKMNIITSQQNQDAVFGLHALEEIESQRFEAGITFTQWDRTNKVFQQIPFSEIEDIIYDPLNKSQLRYVKRVVNYSIMGSDGNPRYKEYKEWIPVSTYAPERFMRRIGDVDVNIEKRMVITRVNRKTDAVFGVPDAFAAAPWALAYSAYLRDGTKVLAALAEWVWKVSPKKRPAAERAATAVRTERGAGGTLFTDMDVQSLPKADAIDLNTGRPLASQVAAALGISIVVLLADPGQSGAYGTAQTLADPNRRTMQARRQVNTEFLKECLRLVGVDKPDITWAKMAPGTDKEEVELLAQIWGTGLFQPLEIRPRMAAIGQITLIEDEAPDGVIIPNNERSLTLASDLAIKQAEASSVDADGTTSQNNGVGRDNVKTGARSRTKQSDTEKSVQK
jgi:hypothetical protein